MQGMQAALEPEAWRMDHTIAAAEEGVAGTGLGIVAEDTSFVLEADHTRLGYF